MPRPNTPGHKSRKLRDFLVPETKITFKIQLKPQEWIKIYFSHHVLVFSEDKFPAVDFNEGWR